MIPCVGGAIVLNTSSAVINQTLTDMRFAISKKRCIPIHRKKNMDTLAILGITWQDVFDEMRALTRSDYIAGPEIDRNSPGSDYFWIFMKKLYGHNIYIKFKVEYKQNNEVKVVSFHIEDI